MIIQSYKKMIIQLFNAFGYSLTYLFFTSQYNSQEDSKFSKFNFQLKFIYYAIILIRLFGIFDEKSVYFDKKVAFQQKFWRKLHPLKKKLVEMAISTDPSKILTKIFWRTNSPSKLQLTDRIDILIIRQYNPDGNFDRVTVCQNIFWWKF